MFGILACLMFTSGYLARHSVAKCEDDRRQMSKHEVLSTKTARTQLASSDLSVTGDVDLRPVETFLRVVAALRDQYVEQITAKDEGRMTYDAVKAMLASLKDPNTRFFEPAQLRTLSDIENGKFHGIGAWLGVRQVKTGSFTDEHLIVIAPLPGSPAEKAGLKPGDDILEINGKAVLPFDPFQRLTDMIKESRSGQADRKNLQKRFDDEQKRIENGIMITDAQNLLMSEENKNLDMTVLSKGAAKERKIMVQPAVFELDPVTSAVEDGDYGYVRINCFCSGTPASFDQAMADLNSKQLKGLVLDLRNVGGGDMESALRTARWFAPGKTLASVVRSRNRRAALKIPSAPENGVWNKPIAVLINRGTARTAEVLADGLKEFGVAKLVGETSYGDFTETALMEQPDGSGVMMTTGKYLSPKGVDLGKNGLKADVTIPPNATSEEQLKMAIKALKAPEGRS